MQKKETSNGFERMRKGSFKGKEFENVIKNQNTKGPGNSFLF